MTALLELKQKIKGVYGQYEMYILPVLKFVLAMVYFSWINSNMGYMSQLNNIFLVLILALICSILPSAAMMYVGFVLILGHSYALGIEVAAFVLVIIFLMLIFFLRFSGSQNITFVFTPLSFAFSIPHFFLLEADFWKAAYLQFLLAVVWLCIILSVSFVHSHLFL